MDIQTMTRELRDDLAQDLLHNAGLARLAYAGPDGLPRVIPVGFHWDGEHVVVCTAPTSPKTAAISKNPEVALTIDVMEPTPRALLIRGTASVEIVDGVPAEYLAAAGKSQDEQQRQEFEANVRRIYKQMARISIAPGWARAYDFQAGPVPRFMQQLAADAG